MLDYIEVSKKLCYVLRHNPSAVHVTMDKKGWVNVDDLVKGMGINRNILEKIVEEDDKRRYAFSPDKKFIRANQGHSVNVEMDFDDAYPLGKLYHGTSERFLEAIKAEGLKPMSRQYVHLSSNRNTALKVGRRHGKPVILTIDAKRMADDGYKFYLSDNNVWLTEQVPWKYVKISNF